MEGLADEKSEVLGKRVGTRRATRLARVPLRWHVERARVAPASPDFSPSSGIACFDD